MNLIFFWGDSQAKWLKMWLGFSRLLPGKCKRKDVRRREELNPKGSRAWWNGIFLATRLQKTLKSGASLSRKSVLDTKPRVWLDDLCLMSPKAQRVWVFSHRDVSLKRIGMWFMDPQLCQQNTKLKIWLSKTGPGWSFFSKGVDSCDMPRNSQGSWNSYTTRNIAGLDQKGEIKMQKGDRTHPNPTVRSQAGKTNQHQIHVLLMKTGGWLEGWILNLRGKSQKSRGQSWKPQRTSPRLLNRTLMPQLHFKAAWECWYFFFFLPFLPFWIESSITGTPRLSYYYILGANNLFLEFHSFAHEEEFSLRME